MNSAFFSNQLTEFLFLHILAFCEGIMVMKLDIKVNYTRKLNHFAVFFTPYVLIRLMPYHESFCTTILGVIISLCTLLIYIRPLRENVSLFRFMFAAFDRPEDRPHTLRWLFTQYLATYIVALPFYFYFKHIGKSEFMVMIILINAIGDGLAEPVGVRFGKHKYSVSALFTDKKYTRSWEGSACVLLSAIFILIFNHASFTPVQFYSALFALPVVMTLAEAFSPHTWDSPIIFLAGGITFMLISLI